jgi:hypothetical protein
LIARGDAYFENWHANLAQVSDPRVRERAEAHKPELQQGLANIKEIAQQTREPFDSFLAGLRALRRTVETDPNAIQAESTKELGRKTEESSRQVQQGLESMAKELKTMTLLLDPSDNKPKA